jgi:L-ascorbate metabolism protein UlaG (beta-lactamase superfamily)
MALKIHYLGWSAFELITQNDIRILLDPMLAGDESYGIPPSPLPMDALYGVDFVVITHSARDHVGQAFEIMKRSQAILVCDVTTRYRALLEEGISGDRIYQVVSGIRYAFEDFTIKGLAAQHISLNNIQGSFISSQPLSYLIGTTTGEQVFFGGDTSIHGDLKLYGELYKPHVAILGVGGAVEHGRSLAELYPDEAALAAKWLGVRLAIPMHFREKEGEEFIRELRNKAPEAKGILMKPGERYTFELSPL